MIAAPSLFDKVFLILSFQIFITWLSTAIIGKYLTKLYYEKAESLARVIKYFEYILLVDIALFLILLFIGRSNLSIGIPIFVLWSVTTGALLALPLVLVDENVGAKILAITASVTLICALIGMYSGIDFSPLEEWLFIALVGLIGGNGFRIFWRIDRWTHRIMAFFGVMVFSGYLLFDFNRLMNAAKNTHLNTWTQALGFSIDIYLDVINLFLEILHLLSDWQYTG